ncbi:hypothetical protein C804_03221 [Lachnospiraceae bacterium A4]|nr:hypothetical protein C804_03221 [Lachnospiraceae bacterium A4]
MYLLVQIQQGQPPNVNNNSISNYPPKNNSKVFETVSMAELYDTVYPSKPPLIDSLLYTGTYLFAGAPKLSKSFLMAQIAYHISRGIPLWDYPVEGIIKKGTGRTRLQGRHKERNGT